MILRAVLSRESALVTCNGNWSEVRIRAIRKTTSGTSHLALVRGAIALSWSRAWLGQLFEACLVDGSAS